jgi:hypothetical protein
VAKLLYNDIVFDEFATRSFYESEFERIVISRAASIFPGFFLVPFKSLVSSEIGSARADLALVACNYHAWWVVEVELSGHSFAGHVLPQIRVLGSAAYGEHEANLLCGSSNHLNILKVRAMMKGDQPRVLVLADEFHEEWVTPLAAANAALIGVEIYRSDRNQVVLRIEGQAPEPPIEAWSECRFDALLPRLLGVRSPGILDVEPGQRVAISYGPYLTEWTRLDVGNKVWLAPVGRNVLDVRHSYRLVKDSSGEMRLQARL